jgi:hypothetical protein
MAILGNPQHQKWHMPLKLERLLDSIIIQMHGLMKLADTMTTALAGIPIAFIVAHAPGKHVMAAIELR